jgi:hypothetical protein
MAGPYFVDDSGDGDGGLSWAKAETSINDLDAAVAFASDEIVYFGADMQCQATNSANLTITGPASGPPTYFISSTVGSGTTVSYAASTTKQIDTTEGAYTLTFDGNFALYGLSVASGSSITIKDAMCFNCRFAPAANSSVGFGSVNYFVQRIKDCVIDLTADGTSNRSVAVLAFNYVGTTEINGLTFVNAAYRTGTVLGQSQGGRKRITGADFSGFTNATACELIAFANVNGELYLANCVTAATWTPGTGTIARPGHVVLTNVGPADAPASLYDYDAFGTALSTTSIYRTGGAAVEGTATSWLITTTANCGEGAPFYTPWIFFKVAAAGTKTIDLYTVNDSADYTDAEMWLEVEAMGTADSPKYSLTTDQRATITTTAAAQTDDTASTWNGTGPSFTYKQKLSASVVVGEEGLCRARVAVGKVSIASSAYFYVDPQVFVDGIAAGTGAYLVPGAGVVDYSGGASPRIGDRTGGLR